MEDGGEMEDCEATDTYECTYEPWESGISFRTAKNTLSPCSLVEDSFLPTPSKRVSFSYLISSHPLILSVLGSRFSVLDTD